MTNLPVGHCAAARLPVRTSGSTAADRAPVVGSMAAARALAVARIRSWRPKIAEQDPERQWPVDVVLLAAAAAHGEGSALAGVAINRAMSPVEWGLLAALGVLWGASFFFAGIAVKELPTFTVVASRVGLAAVILQVSSRFGARAPPPTGNPWAAYLVMGLLNNVVPFSLIVWGQRHIPSSLAAILNATTPLFTVAVAHALTVDERLTSGRLLGAAIGLIGVGATMASDAPRLLGAEAASQLACLAAAVCYAFAGVFGRRFRALGVSPLRTAAGQLTAASIALLPISAIIDRPWTLAVPSAATWAALIAQASASTALGYVLYFRILATAGATNLLLVTILSPVSAIVLAVGILGETLVAKHIFGMLLIVCGLAVTDGRPWRALMKSWRAARANWRFGKAERQ
jgi:drug/metabolite transporter (DMT)-like permease